MGTYRTANSLSPRRQPPSAPVGKTLIRTAEVVAAELEGRPVELTDDTDDVADADDAAGGDRARGDRRRGRGHRRAQPRDLRAVRRAGRPRSGTSTAG